MSMNSKIQKSDQEWKESLTEQEFRILRKKETEPPFTGKFVYNKEKGVYVCAGCGNELFSSDTKFESGSGWPSFWEPLIKGNIELKSDTSLGIQRIEVLCRRCGGHLGHVFDDGPQPTGKRYCVNSASLHFQKNKL